jgi:hypothetical protein
MVLAELHPVGLYDAEQAPDIFKVSRHWRRNLLKKLGFISEWPVQKSDELSRTKNLRGLLQK